MSDIVTNIEFNKEPIQINALANKINVKDVELIENGTYTPDSYGADGFGQVKVNVPKATHALEELTITENGEYLPSEGVDGFSKVTADVKTKVKSEVPIRSVTFIDFDGTVLYSYSVKEYAQLTELPAPPTHWEHLNFIGWTHTLEETQNNREQIIGARYELKEPEKMYFTIVVDNYECSIKNAQQATRATIDWGDGTTDPFPTNYAVLTHRYAKNGEYNVCVYGSILPEGTHTSISSPITYNFSNIFFLKSYFPYNPEKVGYGNYRSKVMYKLGETLGTFVNMTGLEWLVMTDKLTATSINISASARLIGCNFNDKITSIASRQNLDCFKLCRLPNNSTLKMPTLTQSGLQELYIPNSITTLGTSITNLPTNAKKIHIMRSVVEDGDITALPFSLTDTEYFALKIYVPSDSLEAYKTATNWSAIADKIFPEEE